MPTATMTMATTTASHNPMQTLLDELEWDEGLTMPVANASNKRVEDQLLKVRGQIASLQDDYRETDDRVMAMTSHLKNVSQELHHTQALADARGKEVETVNHMYKLTMREHGRLKQELLKLDTGLSDVKEKKNISENTIFRKMQELEQMKAQMNWDQEALEAWLEECARKDEDTMILEKYAREDEGKVKDLTLKITQLTEIEQRRKRQLDNETMNTHTAQIELDKTAEEFRQCHGEREELLCQWENSIDQMKVRDAEMDDLTHEIVKAKMEVRKRQEVINEKMSFNEAEIENNKELDRKISMAERQAAKGRNEIQRAETDRDTFGSELEALKRTVDRTALDLESVRSKITFIKKDVNEKSCKSSLLAKESQHTLVDRLRLIEESTLSAEEMSERVDHMMTDEENARAMYDEEMRRLRSIQFRMSQKLYSINLEEKNICAELQGGRAAIRNLNSKISVLDTDSLKQQEIIYNEDYTIQQLERRANRMQGDQSNEERIVLQTKIDELNAELNKKVSIHDVLRLQLKRLQEDLRRVGLTVENSGKDNAKHVNKVEEIELHNDNSQRELNKITIVKQQLMVDKNMLQLDIRRLRKLLFAKADHVHSLEQRKLQLMTAMKERHKEIEVHKDMIMAQIRSAEEQKCQVSSELHERIAMVDKLKKRYEIQIMAMAPPEGEEERSQAYYVIKAAQEKEELQRHGDELDAQIRKAEKEIRALENTLRLMNSRNETYRKSFNNVEESSEEMDQKHDLEEQLRAVMDKYKYKRRQIREINEDLHQMTATMDQLVSDEHLYKDMMQDKQSKVMVLNKEIKEQLLKLDRVNKQNVKTVKKYHTAQGITGPSEEEIDIDMQILRDQNKMAVKEFTELASLYPEASPIISLCFEQAGIDGASSTPSISSMSSRSSMNSGRSSLHSCQLSVITLEDLMAKSTSSSSRSSPKVSLAGSQRASPLSSARSSSSQASRKAGATLPSINVRKQSTDSVSQRSSPINGMSGMSVTGSRAGSRAGSRSSTRKP